jgi:hypothetical protein
MEGMSKNRSGIFFIDSEQNKESIIKGKLRSAIEARFPESLHKILEETIFSNQ